MREQIWTSRGEPQTPKLPCEREGCGKVVRLRVRAHDGAMVCMATWVEEAGEGRFPTQVLPP